MSTGIDWEIFAIISVLIFVDISLYSLSNTAINDFILNVLTQVG